jgi:hypothetical protein
VLDLTMEEPAMAARQQRDFVRRLVVARCPELSLDEIEAAFGMDYTYTDDVLAEIADAVTDAVEAFEARLDRLEGNVSRRLQ